MRCLSCGCSIAMHIRADGACVSCSCPAFVDKWPEVTPEAEPLPPPPVKKSRPDSEK